MFRKNYFILLKNYFIFVKRTKKDREREKERKNVVYIGYTYLLSK